MIHGRGGGDRMYDLTTRLVAPRLLEPAPAADAERHLFRQGMLLYGLPNASELLAVQRMASLGPLHARNERCGSNVGRRRGASSGKRGRLEGSALDRRGGCACPRGPAGGESSPGVNTRFDRLE